MNELLQSFLVKILGPLLDRTGTEWKTITGLAVYLTIAVFRLLAVQYGTDHPTFLQFVTNITPWVEDSALALTGIGLYHKALKTETP